MTVRVDYVLKNGERGVWDYEAKGNYENELSYINKKLDGKLDRLVFVQIQETDILTLTHKGIYK